jgi:hypothetical protein
MRKLRTRIAVGAAVATFAGAATFAAVSVTSGGSAAGNTALTAATTTTVTAKTGTTLSVAVRKSTVQAGRLDLISGTLATGSAPNGRRIVELYRYNPKTKKWFPARVNFTRKGGKVRFIIRPLATAQYELVYHGNAHLAGSHSSPVTVTVTT